MILLLGFFLLAGISAASPASAWDRPEATWSDADARLILMNSPWAKTSRSSITVRWEDALPVKLALRRVGISPATDETGQAYAIAVVFPDRRVPQDVRPNAELRIPGCPVLNAAGFKILDEDHHRRIVVFWFRKSGMVTQPGIVRFPLGISIPTHQIEFSAGIGPLKIKTTFAMHRMVFGGRTEL